MRPHLELPAAPIPSRHRILADFGPLYAANGFIGVFCVTGLLTLAMSWAYREPLAFFWTIPGTVLVGPSLQHLSFPEVIGAFYATSVLILVLGASGFVKRAMMAVPMPIVMGMVAGVFLRFGLDLVRALHGDVAIAAPMVITFLALSALPALGRRMPPLIGALLVGALIVAVLGRVDASSLGSFQIVRPVVQAPVWSMAAMIELVVPLAITVLVVQNGQGFAVLQAAGHNPPINASTVMCGIGSVFSALVGAVSSCLTGPTNALITSSGERERHYTAAMFTGLLAIVFGLIAPAFTGLMLAAPKEYIMMLGGLAMLRVLQASFIASFRDRFSLGALVSFLVTVADLAVLNIGAAFWGLIAGFAVSWLLEKQDFVTLPDAR